MVVRNVLPMPLVASQAKYAKPIHIGHMCTLGRSFEAHTEYFERVSHVYVTHSQMDRHLQELEAFTHITFIRGC